MWCVHSRFGKELNKFNRCRQENVESGHLRVKTLWHILLQDKKNFAGFDIRVKVHWLSKKPTSKHSGHSHKRPIHIFSNKRKVPVPMVPILVWLYVSLALPLSVKDRPDTLITHCCTILPWPWSSVWFFCSQHNGFDFHPNRTAD